MPVKKQSHEYLATAALALGSALAYSDLADQPETRALWLEMMSVWLRYTAYGIQARDAFTKGQLTSLNRIIDSLSNLVAALPWIADGNRTDLQGDTGKLADLVAGKK